MKKYKFLSILLLTIIFASLFTPLTVYAEEASYKTAVFDNANLLTPDEETKLYNYINKQSKKYGVDIVILTTNNTNGKSTMVYTDDFYDGIEGSTRYGDDGLLFAIDMYNREIYINTVGKCIDEISGSELDRALDAGYSAIKQNLYYKTLTKMMDKIFNSMPSKNVFSNIVNCLIPKVTFEGLVFPIILTVIFIVLAIKSHKKGMKPISAQSYGENKKGYNLKDKKEEYIRSYQTVDHGYYRKSSSGGSGSHRSSSGRSHGGGGRRF